jgi:hypothetical protein
MNFSGYVTFTTDPKSGDLILAKRELVIGYGARRKPESNPPANSGQ